MRKICKGGGKADRHLCNSTGLPPKSRLSVFSKLPRPPPRPHSAAPNSEKAAWDARPGAPPAVGGSEDDAVRAGGRPTAAALPRAAAPPASRPLSPPRPDRRVLKARGRGAGARASSAAAPRRGSLSAATRRLPPPDQNSCERLRLARSPSFDAHSGSLARSPAGSPRLEGAGRKRSGAGGWGVGDREERGRKEEGREEEVGRSRGARGCAALEGASVNPSRAGSGGGAVLIYKSTASR